MSLMAHLEELRIRVLRFAVVFFVCLLGAYAFRQEILNLIKAPVEEPLARYSHSQSAPAMPGQAEGLLDLDQYHCSCTRSPKAELLTAPAFATESTQGVTPTFPLAEVPHQEVPTSIESLSELLTRKFNEAVDSGVKDFRAFYYSSIGNNQKAAEIYQGEAAPLDPPQSYKDSDADILELSCRCTKEGAKPAATMVYIGLPELFFAQMQVSVYAALFLSFPFLLLELWGFVGPALYQDEKIVFWGFGISTFVFFIGGALFGYFVVFPYGFDFFLSLTQPGEIMPSLAIGEYLDFTVKLFLAFGLIFELPVVVFILARLGVLTPKMMIVHGRAAVVIIFIVSAVLTPPDPFTMILMAAPLLVLYLFSIFVCFIGLNKKKATLRSQGINPEEFDEY